MPVVSPISTPCCSVARNLHSILLLMFFTTAVPSEPQVIRNSLRSVTEHRCRRKRPDVFDYIEIFCDRIRRHGRLGGANSGVVEHALLTLSLARPNDPAGSGRSVGKKNMETMKKFFFAIALAILSGSVSADGPTSIHGVNAAGETIYADEEERHEEEPVTTPKYVRLGHWSIRVGPAENSKQVFPKQYCSNYGPAFQKGWTFTCSADGVSPLAGATYVFERGLPKCGGFLFVCQNGCGPRAPRTLVKDLWECGEE